MIETEGDYHNHREYAIADIALYDDDDAIIKKTDAIENYDVNDYQNEADTNEIISIDD
jgi:hypothetical protein